MKKLRLEAFLPYQLSLLSNTVSGAIARLYFDKFAISMVEWRIMAVLGECPDISADDICRQTRIEKSVVSRALNKLIERHLVNRITDNADRRRSILALTNTGQEVYAEISPIALEYEAGLIAVLNPDERNQLKKLISRLQSQADKLSNAEPS